MEIDERGAELNDLFETGQITQKEWSLLWTEAQEDEITYSDKEQGNGLHIFIE